MEPTKKVSDEPSLRQAEDLRQPGRSYRWAWWLALIVVAAGLILWMTDSFPVAGSGGPYQAVFLTNNQVYFGKLLRPDSQYPVLRDVYYLQVTQTLQPPDQNAPATNISLVKLGGELHGPESTMFINRDQILFYEDLKDDSQVVQAIKQNQANQGN